MKKYFFLFCFLLIPKIVLADQYCSNEQVDNYCTGDECLSSLQANYNTWNATDNTGRSCIKVIAQRNGNDKTYFEGKNPATDYKCADGTEPTAELVLGALSDQDVIATSQVIYIPELWTVSCGDSDVATLSTPEITTQPTTTVTTIGTTVATNDSGQIVGTTTTAETGVETYFLVLFALCCFSYLIFVISKKITLFKKI